MSDSMAMWIACPTANELWELAEREREREEGQATVASAAQCPKLKWRRRYKKGVKKFYFLCSYYDLMDVYDTKKQKKKMNRFYALYTLLRLSLSLFLFLSPHTDSHCFSCLTSDAYKSKQSAKWAAAASTPSWDSDSDSDSDSLLESGVLHSMVCLINSRTIDMLSGKLRHWHANVSGCRDSRNGKLFWLF